MRKELSVLLSLMLFAGAMLFAGPAPAGAVAGGDDTVPGWLRMSHVEDMVIDNANGTWTYLYSVWNDSDFGDFNLSNPNFSFFEPYIRDWELPWFGDAGITDIMSPEGWSWSIETIGAANPLTGWDGVAFWQDPNDPFYAGANSPFTTVTQVLHWYSDLSESEFSEFWIPPDAEGENRVTAELVLPFNALGGFGFIADFDETAAPYQASWAFLEPRTGDPAFPLGGLPGSPATQGQPPVPEPGTVMLLGVGLLCLARTRRRS